MLLPKLSVRGGGLFAVLIVSMSGILFAAASDTTRKPAFVDAVWVAEKTTLSKYSSESGELLFDIPDLKDLRQIAVDSRNGKVWAALKEELRQYDFAGQLVTTIPFPAAPGEDDSDKSELEVEQLFVDATDQSLWLTTEKSLYRYNAKGVLQGNLIVADEIESVAISTAKGKVWIAGKDVIQVYPITLDGKERDIRLSGENRDEIKRIAWDSTLEQLWVLSGKELFRLDDQDNIVFEKSVKQLDEFILDGQGNAWLNTGKALIYLTSRGQELINLEPIDEKGDNIIRQLAVDPADQSVWASGKENLVHLSLTGEILQQITTHDKIHDIALYRDTVAPTIQFILPTEGSITNNPSPTIQLLHQDVGIGVDQQTLVISQSSNPLPTNCSHSLDTSVCEPISPFTDGNVSLEAAVKDYAGNLSEPAGVNFTVDTIPPTVTVTAPPNPYQTNVPRLTIKGQLSESAALTLNNNPITVDPQLAFETGIDLQEGNNALVLRATDPAGNTGQVELLVILDTQPPVKPDETKITVGYPEEGSVTISGEANSVEPGSRVNVNNSRTTETVSVPADANGAFSLSIAAQGGDVLQISASDAVGNTSDVLEVVVETPPGDSGPLPPDPATVAPALSETGITPFHEATSFLYSGSNPIQREVEPGAIEDYRATVVRGRVLDRRDQPLSGVKITIKDHPELGHTLSRVDGVFDLVVNGGGLVTVQYEREGHLPVQRKIKTAWNEYTWLPDVLMIPLDDRVTTIDLTASTPIQVARGNPVTDADGTRHATLLFPQGTRAHMVMPNGTTQPLNTLNVRATEYTVGENGPKAMPGELPPMSGYTYAVELSVDEAMAAGAKHVQFDRPVPFYVENFIGFPVGSIVPVGWYDYDKAAWVPSENGRVIEILAIEGELAELDVDGTGSPAGAGVLQELGITDSERRQLARLYKPGDSLWRTPVEHFTPWDYNWPYGPPDGAEPPTDELPEKKDEYDPEDPCEKGGCLIEAENQVLGETIPIVGTPYTLNYRSNRVDGFMASRSIDIPISDEQVPDSLLRIELEISVAGQVHRQTFEPAPNLNTTFTWNGMDDFGRPVTGPVRLTYRLRFVYPVIYLSSAEFGRAFGQAGSAGINATRGSAELDFYREHSVTLNGDMTGRYNLGRWSLAPHHYYDRRNSMLHLGDGSRRSATGLDNIITTVAGTGVKGYSGDGGPATQAQIEWPRDITFSPDGSLYIVDSQNHLIRHVGPDGVITTVAGTGVGGYSGDGGLATDAKLYRPYGIALGPDGSLYIADTGNNRIRHVGPDGVITTVAGTGVGGYSGDGGPATQADLRSPFDITLGLDGSLYIADTYNNRIRHVGPDGVITTVAGTGVGGYSGDGSPAIEAQLNRPFGIALGPDGSLYIADTNNHRIRHVGLDGVITTVVGTGDGGYSGDGGPATQAQIEWSWDIALAPDGSLYIADIRDNRIRHVGPDGVITTVAGTGVGGYSGDSDPATQADLRNPNGITLGLDGSLYIADTSNNRIRRVSSATSSAGVGEVEVPSSENNEFFVFGSGRHLRTIDSITGSLRHEFVYDEQGALIRIKDGNGNATRIERDSYGQPLAIIAPDGQRTELGLDDNGNLTSMTNPAGETWRMEYTNDGLLTRVEKPNNAVNTFTYDALGRLVEDVDPVGGGWTLQRNELENGYESIMTSGEGRTTRFRVENLGDTQVRRTTNPDGTINTREITTADTEVVETATAPDGTQYTQREVPDPRFGMQAPYVGEAVTTTPGGKVLEVHTQRTVTLADENDVLSHTTLGESITINGRTYGSNYEAATRTWTSTSPAGRQATTVLNATGQPASNRYADLAPTTYRYDTRGRVESLLVGEGTQERNYAMAYDSNGYLQQITDPLGRSVKYEYDAAGRVTRQTLPDGRAIGFTYDPNGNVTSITPPGKSAHVYDYTAVDQAQSYTPPDLSGVQTVTQYTYNKDKQLELITRPDGQQLDYIYDDAGRLATLSIPRGQYQYGYSTQSGQITGITAPDGNRLAYSYDGFLPLSETYTGNINGTVERSYDNNFNVTAQSINGTPVNYAYDNDNLLTRAGSLGLSRNAQNGLLIGTGIGSITTQRGYNNFGEMTAFGASFNTTALYDVNYTRDALGRITRKTETIDGATTIYDYQYDLAGRLTRVSENGIVVAGYTYDSNGNRLSRTTPQGSESGTYDEQDRLLTYTHSPSPSGGGVGERVITYDYTLNGELTGKTENGATTTYDYDVLGNLMQVSLPDDTTVEYIVDGRNRRIGKKLNGQLVQGFLYQDSLNPVTELDGQGNILSRFVYGSKPNVPDYLIRYVNGSETTYRIISDHLGSPRRVVNVDTGEIIQKMDYDEFGRVITDTNPAFQPFGFAGGLYDPHTGLVRFGARDYDPQTGRWTSKDPIRFAGGDTNLYGYVTVDPVNYFDVTGNNPITGQGTTSTGPTGNPIRGPYRSPPSAGEQAINMAASTVVSKLTGGIAKVARKTGKIVPNVSGIIIGAITPTLLGCSSYDCDNNGIDDRLEDADPNNDPDQNIDIYNYGPAREGDALICPAY